MYVREKKNPGEITYLLLTWLQTKAMCCLIIYSFHMQDEYLKGHNLFFFFLHIVTDCTSESEDVLLGN